jgi:hypothetical protein
MQVMILVSYASFVRDSIAKRVAARLASEGKQHPPAGDADSPGAVIDGTGIPVAAVVDPAAASRPQAQRLWPPHITNMRDDAAKRSAGAGVPVDSSAPQQRAQAAGHHSMNRTMAMGATIPQPDTDSYTTVRAGAGRPAQRHFVSAVTHWIVRVIVFLRSLLLFFLETLMITLCLMYRISASAEGS